MRLFLTALLLVPAPAALAFERPVPQPQTEAAEVWFLVASIALVAALGAVQIMVRRK